MLIQLHWRSKTQKGLRCEFRHPSVLGATRWTTFRKVVFPHVRAGVVAGGLLSFARAMGEFGAVVILSGNLVNRTLTAPVFLWQLLSQFKPDDAAAVATLLFGLSFALVLVTERLIARELRA